MREAERVRETERMKLAEEAKRKEREALARRQREEREAKERLEREKRNNKERYVLYKAVFKENKFDLFVPSVTNDMEKLGGELCYLLPSEESEISFYHVMFETNGMKKVSHLYEDGTLDEVGADEFFGMIKNLEYLVAKEDTVHFRSIKKNPRSGRLSMKGEADPSETFFGMLTPILKSLRPTYDELTFDIYFTPNGDTKKIFVENIPFGASWSFENVRDAVANNTVVKYKVPGGGKKARFKRTVKIWNGSRIKQGIDGITYVPSVMPPQSNHSRWFCNYGGGRIIYRSRITSNNTPERWQVLYDKALQEEQEEAAFYAQQKRFHEASRASAQAKAMEKWQSKVDAVIKDGTLSYTIRKAKVLKDGK